MGHGTPQLDVPDVVTRGDSRPKSHVSQLLLSSTLLPFSHPSSMVKGTRDSTSVVHNHRRR